MNLYNNYVIVSFLVIVVFTATGNTLLILLIMSFVPSVHNMCPQIVD